MKPRKLFEFLPMKMEILEGDDAKKKAEEQGFLVMLKGTAMNAGRVTLNRTLYPRALVHREISRIQPLLTDGRVIGLADHPGFLSNEVLATAVRWTEAWIEKDSTVKVVGGVLNTEGGRTIHQAMAGGVRFGISSRGYGSTVSETMGDDHDEWELNKDLDGVEFEEIQDDYELESWDVVLKPSNENSFTEKEIKEALARLEAAASNNPEGASLMDIKNLKDLTEKISAEALQTITAELRDGFVDKDEHDKAVNDAKDEGKTEGATEALADGAKIAEATGLSESALGYAKENAEKIEALAETHTPLGEPAQAPADDDKTKTLQDQVNTLSEQIVESESKRQAMADALRAERADTKVRALVDECTKGEVAAGLLAEDVKDRYEASADFDPDNEDSVKAEKEKILKAVEKRKADLSAHLDLEALRPGGKGKSAPEGGDADDVKSKREAFASDHPDFAVESVEDLDIARGAVLGQSDAVLTAKWMEAYGPKALETLPLGK